MDTRERAQLATTRRLLAALVNEGMARAIATADGVRLVAIDAGGDDALDVATVPAARATPGQRVLTLDPTDVALAPVVASPDGRALTHPADVFRIVARWLCLPADVAARLEGELSSSAENQEIALLHRVAAPSLDAPAIAWEQAMVEGHPSHPLHRAKVGLTAADVLRWSAETGGGPDVRFVALPRVDAVVLGDFEAILRPWLPDETRAAALAEGDVVVLPVHPGQLGKIAMIAPLARILPGSKPALAQTSLRTVHATGLGYHLKLSLAVHATSAMRTVSPQSVHNGPIVTAALRPIVPPHLYVIGEPAAAALRHSDDGVAKHLACIVREDPEVHLPGERCIVAAALTEINAAGENLAVATFGLDTRDKRLAFLDRYAGVLLDCFVPPLRDYGVAFEAHGQNVVARFDGKGQLLGFAVRDFGGLKIHLATLEAKTGRPLQLHPGSTITADTLYDANAKLFHTVVQHHLHYLVRALGLHHDGSGWALVRAHAARLLAGTDFASWWNEAEVEFKQLLTMRLENTPYDKFFSKIPNVLLTGAHPIN